MLLFDAGWTYPANSPRCNEPSECWQAEAFFGSQAGL